MNLTEEIIDAETSDSPMAVSVKYPADGQRYWPLGRTYDEHAGAASWAKTTALFASNLL